MTPKQKALVQSSFTQLIPVCDSAARFFYNRLFQLDPKLRLLFKGDMQEQGRKLMQMIGIAVGGLDQSEALIAPLSALGGRHVEYGVTSRDYETMGRALIATLEAELGPKFTEETRDAWIAVYNLLASVMQERADSAPYAGGHIVRDVG
jgi:hemoglobin-like flavoprotein